MLKHDDIEDYALRKKSKDIDAIGEYFFELKDKFIETCEKEIDPRLRTFLIVDLKDTQTDPHEYYDAVSILF